ncbi:MAG: carbohydrate kinase [Chitinophagaceae bacterium]|nr:carbohydrate kinase [Chitinophagaceae bacterium]
MPTIPVIAIFDIGKTNKKLFLFDEEYNVVFEKSVRLKETVDGDGESAEDVDALKKFVLDSLREINSNDSFAVRAVNVSAYGASFVLIDNNGDAIAPVYNYLKSYPTTLADAFYNKYGGNEKFSQETASPVLGSLNSGLQLYRLKEEQPATFARVHYALHLPQYLSSIITGEYYSEITSIGCHTALWDFTRQFYHQWTIDERIVDKLPPIVASTTTINKVFEGTELVCGIGLHDSSAALIPYLASFHQPFILISTGTWCISLNPFNRLPLTTSELNQDCLCYKSYHGVPVKASRLFAGNMHEQVVSRLCTHFNKPMDYYKQLSFDEHLVDVANNKLDFSVTTLDLNKFRSFEEGYYQLLHYLILEQHRSTKLVMQGPAVKTIFVDGGFSQNSIYMHLLAKVFSDCEVYAASMPQASALGAALAIHGSWNKRPLPLNLIRLNHYTGRLVTNRNNFI